MSDALTMADEALRRQNAKTKAYLTNPFLKKDGSLANRFIDYRALLASPGLSDAAAEKISRATGLSRPSRAQKSNESEKTAEAKTTAKTTTKTTTAQTQTGSFSGLVGKRVANTAAYNNSAVKGQCVWYARGRAQEKLGVALGSLGNANQMFSNAKASARVAASAANIRPNMLVTYKTGVSRAGAPYGHVIFIEDVVGDTVYYTEGGSSYYKNGTDGVVKTASREGIMKGVNSGGGKMGTGVIGFIDLNSYK